MTDLSAEYGPSDSQKGTQVVVEPEYLEYLRSHGYPILDVTDVQIAASESRDLAHVVCRIKTYEYPKGHEKLDVAAHEAEIAVCSCEDYQYNQAPDVSEHGTKPTDGSTCKHCRRAYKAIRAQNDDRQETLE